ncbi:MAG: hypothetical protein HZB16_00910 [Armatimonadetes bacterium]|nr:hypothetical protein [Armatimonadota bacterium]
MSLPFVLAALAGLVCFLTGLGCAAWTGQDPTGRWRAGAWRWLLLAAGGILVMAAGLHLAGVDNTGLWFPGWRTPPAGG